MMIPLLSERKLVENVFFVCVETWSVTVVVVFTENCIYPLGLESGYIPDEALSHSVDTANTKSNPWDIRLNKEVDEFPNGWQAALGELDYLQVIILKYHLWKQTNKK